MPAQLHDAAPWPLSPSPDEGVAARMAWYAAVARWAPSKHNSQPWRFVARAEGLEVWADPSRVLPATDPSRRELLLACGAAVAHARIAARCLGRKPVVRMFPDGPGDLVARLTDEPGHETTQLDRALLGAVPRRRTDRGPLDDTGLSPALPFLLQSAASGEGGTLQLVRSPGDRSTLGSLVERADRLLVRRPEVDAEVQEWVREEGDPRADGVPARSTRGPGSSYRAEFVQRDFSSPGSHPEQDRAGTDHPLIGVLCTRRDQPADWVLAGEALTAVLLQATLAGANASYLNQPVEETAIRAQLQERLWLPGFPQAVLRIGIGGDVPPTPRRPLDDVLTVA